MIDGGVAGVAPPALIGEMKKDMLTGTPAPVGRRYGLAGATYTMPDMGKIVDRSRSAVEVADMWTPGDPDMGIQPRRSDGRILPRIDHVPCVMPLTDLAGGVLEQSESAREIYRRGWYAGQMRAAPRLTPVHHILGASAQEWSGALSAADAEKRDEWRAKLWEPESLRLLTETHGHLYTLDWERLPIEKILLPLTGRLRKASKEHDGNAPILEVCVKRARADLAVITKIARAVKKGDAKTAAKEHAALAENHKVFQKQLAELGAFEA